MHRGGTFSASTTIGRRRFPGKSKLQLKTTGGGLLAGPLVAAGY